MAQAIAFVVLLLGLAVVLGLGILVIRILWRVVTAPPAPRRPGPPDDWDDEEHIARHHH